MLASSTTSYYVLSISLGNLRIFITYFKLLVKKRKTFKQSFMNRHLLHEFK